MTATSILHRPEVEHSHVILFPTSALSQHGGAR
jgi:hypothetical protein